MFRVAEIPLSGNSLKVWIKRTFISGTRTPEFRFSVHIYSILPKISVIIQQNWPLLFFPATTRILSGKIGKYKDIKSAAILIKIATFSCFRAITLSKKTLWIYVSVYTRLVSLWSIVFVSFLDSSDSFVFLYYQFNSLQLCHFFVHLPYITHKSKVTA